jgi:hypothetical protein
MSEAEISNFAVVVEVDNGAEDPEEGRRGLREELAPAMRQMPGVVSAIFMTAHERGVGYGVIVMDSREGAQRLAAGFSPGTFIRDGVKILRAEVLEVAAQVLEPALR